MRNYTKSMSVILLIYIVGQIGVIFYSTRSTLTYVISDIRQITPVERIRITLQEPSDSKTNTFYILQESQKNKSTNNLIFRKTITYNTFTITPPYFIDNTSRTLFYLNKKNLDALAARTEETLFGEIVIVKNGTVDVNLDCGFKSQPAWIHPNRTVPENKWFPALVPLVVPDGHTFQHFLDGTLPKIIQSLTLLQNKSVTIVVRSIRDKIIYEMLEKLNISKSQLVYQSGSIYGADQLIYPCITPPIHPVLWKEGRRQLGAPAELQVPINKAFIVLVTRAGCINCGRIILNKESLTKMLTDRYGPDRVKVFQGPISLNESVELFGSARVIMGSHGGGMYNINFAPSKTAVIEFMPTHKDGEMGAASHSIVWHMAQMLDQEYWRLCIHPGVNNNMTVNLTLLGQILDVVDKRIKSQSRPKFRTR